jgi:hypothetical protein
MHIEDREYVWKRGGADTVSKGMQCLCKSEVLATSGHGSVQSLAEIFVGLVLGKVKLCRTISGDSEMIL